MNPLVRVALAGVLLTGGGRAAEIDADFLGGNIRMVGREGRTFTLALDLRDTKGWWFHTHFRLRGAPGEAVTIVFRETNPIGVRGPAVSSDEGRIEMNPTAARALGPDLAEEIAVCLEQSRP